MAIPATSDQFLSLLFGEDAQHTFQTINKKGECKVFHGRLSDYEDIFRRINQKAAGIFYAINQTDGKGRRTKNITRIRSFVIDLDGTPLKRVLKRLKKSGIAPQVVVETSPKKYHLYIRVHDCPLREFKPIQQAFAVKFNGDKAVCDLPRVMRLPGFYHHKGEPFLTHVIEANDIPALT